MFCDWPCNLQGVYACPATKSILMRDRQPIGDVTQQEVIDTTCSLAQVPTIAILKNNITPEPITIITPMFYHDPSPNRNNIRKQPSSGK